MKKIALDFDETYTAMPQIWDRFISDCKRHGHTVTIVTARGEWENNPSYNHDIRVVADFHGIEVVYTGGEQKSEHFKADIWIDDNPSWIPSLDMLKFAVRTCEAGEP